MKDTKRVIRSHQSKDNTMAKKKKDRKEEQWSTKHNTNLIKNRE
jgi:hypothetical protein